MCIPGYILITVEGLQKINLERAYCILPGEVITWIIAHEEEDGDREYKQCSCLVSS